MWVLCVGGAGGALGAPLDTPGPHGSGGRARGGVDPVPLGTSVPAPGRPVPPPAAAADRRCTRRPGPCRSAKVPSGTLPTPTPHGVRPASDTRPDGPPGMGSWSPAHAIRLVPTRRGPDRGRDEGMRKALKLSRASGEERGPRSLSPPHRCRVLAVLAQARRRGVALLPEAGASSASGCEGRSAVEPLGGETARRWLRRSRRASGSSERASRRAKLLPSPASRSLQRLRSPARRRRRSCFSVRQVLHRDLRDRRFGRPQAAAVPSPPPVIELVRRHSRLPRRTPRETVGISTGTSGPRPSHRSEPLTGSAARARVHLQWKPRRDNLSLADEYDRRYYVNARHGVGWRGSCRPPRIRDPPWHGVLTDDRPGGRGTPPSARRPGGPPTVLRDPRRSPPADKAARCDRGRTRP